MNDVLVYQVIIDVELLGFVYHWNLDVNAITVIGEYSSVVPPSLARIAATAAAAKTNNPARTPCSLNSFPAYWHVEHKQRHGKNVSGGS